MHTTSTSSRAQRATRRWGIAALTLGVLLIIAMASATIIGTVGSQPMADRWVYDTAWFSLLWGALSIAGAVYLLRRHTRRGPVVLLHGAFAVILLGAGVTHLTARRGEVHLRQGVAVESYTTREGTVQPLPFQLTLERFGVQYEADGLSPQDYQSTIRISRGQGPEERAQVAMNHIYHGHGVRLYQQRYDDDLRGSTLAVNQDEWGTGISYTGYALLVAAFLWLLLDGRGRFRGLLRQFSANTGAQRVLLIGLLVALSMHEAEAQRVLPRDVADEAGRTLIAYNGRICPLETFALDFTRKMTGSTSYQGLTACQVLTGVVCFPEDWLQEPFLRIKGRQLRERLGLQEQFVAPQELLSGGYRLGPMLQEAQQGSGKLAEQVLDADDRLMLLMQVMRMDALRMFPYPAHASGQPRWYAPSERQPQGMPTEQQQYVRSILPMMASLAQREQWAQVSDALHRLRLYQQRYGAQSVPQPEQLRAEHAYNHLPIPTLLFILNTALGLLSALLLGHGSRRWRIATTACMAMAWAALTLFLALRWVAQGSIPMGNGYETMLVAAWMVLTLALMAARRTRVATPFGLTVSGLLLLVAHLSEMDPAITQRMPVLQSPLLTLHVGIIMVAYALLILTWACSVAHFAAQFVARRTHSALTLSRCRSLSTQLMPLSLLLLYPAVACLAVGIFLGAVWANVSWGCYWSWDPKETWALITLMIYSVPLHGASLPALRRPDGYHLYLLLALVSIAITYFGVNYLMPGMHSYA